MDEHEIIEAIYDSSIQPELWPTILDNVACAAQGEVACLFEFDPITQRLRRALVNHLPAASDYHAHYAALDPRNRFGIRQPKGTVFTDAAFITSAEVARSEFYNDYLFANEMGHVGARVLEHDARAISGLAIQRSHRLPAFEWAELAILERLAPHLRRSLRLQHSLSLRAGQPAAWTRECLDALPWPVLLLGHEGELVFASKSAEELIRSGCCLRCSRSKLASWHPWDDRCLRIAIVRGLAGSDTQIRLRCSTGGSLIVNVVPLGLTALQSIGDDCFRLSLFLMDPARPPADVQEKLAAWFQFSPAEARLATAMLTGEPLPWIAQRFSLKPSTLKTQLAHLFAKTDTGRQGQLIALLQRAVQLPSSSKQKYESNHGTKKHRSDLRQIKKSTEEQ